MYTVLYNCYKTGFPKLGYILASQGVHDHLREYPYLS